mmetsp:Transcript_13859/g.31141  ORF Transcript_13859/g.31141 Transcript_13859/m.31141 type:complete len:183 (+) Transcript_13859:3-551(+)
MINQNGLGMPMAHPLATRTADEDRRGTWSKTESASEEKPALSLPVSAADAGGGTPPGPKPHNENSSKLVTDTPEVTGIGEARSNTCGPDEFRVQFSAIGKKMGAEIAHGVGRNVGTVRIKSIRPGGLIHDWNMLNPDSQVTENCFILELNGRQIAEMQREDIRTEFRHAKEVTMLLKRAALS